ncbi:MAG: hypothetical protein WA814_00870 [Candidatus Baltobacteraceae bacterium]
MRSFWSLSCLAAILAIAGCSAQQTGAGVMPPSRAPQQRMHPSTLGGLVEIQAGKDLTGQIASDLAGNEWTAGADAYGGNFIVGINEQTDAVSTFDLPGAGDALGFALDPQHAKMWFTVPNSAPAYIENIDLATHVFARYPLHHNANPDGIAAGPDDAMWFTELGKNEHATGRIGRIDLATFAISEYTLPTHLRPREITLGADGALWFSATTGEDQGSIGRITTDGQVSDYAIGANRPYGITTGPDGAIWFAGVSDANGCLIGRIDLYSHARKLYKYAPNNGGNYEIATRDSYLWTTELDDARIDRLDPSTHAVTRRALPNGYYNPFGITLGRDHQLWFTNYGPRGGAFGKLCPDESQQQCSSGS